MCTAKCGCVRVVGDLRALGIQYCFAVPGAPITHLAETAAGELIGFEWSLNEKLAVEAAVGVSVVGRRSVVMCKQNGMNIALDSLMNASVHTLGSALVMLVADDVDSTKSTVIQDTRAISELARVPVLEPTSHADLGLCLATAVQISESAAAPVVVRLTCHPRGEDEVDSLGPLRTGVGAAVAPPSDRADGPRLIDVESAQRTTKIGRLQRRRLTWAGSVDGELSKVQVAHHHCTGDSTLGTIYVGDAARLSTGTDECWIAVRSSSVVSDELATFMDRHSRLVVVEEPLPFMESRLRELVDRGNITVSGRLSGHLAPEGSLSREDVNRAKSGDGRRVFDEVEAKIGPTQFDPKEFGSLFRALADLRNDATFICADVGESVELCYPPFRASDVALCLGSSLAVAGGAARVLGSSIAVIGDFGLLHTALPSLVEIVRRRLLVVVVVMVNGVQAKTGSQPLVDKDTSADIITVLEKLCAGAGFSRIESWSAADSPSDLTAARLRALMADAPAVALVHGGSVLEPAALQTVGGRVRSARPHS